MHQHLYRYRYFMSMATLAAALSWIGAGAVAQGWIDPGSQPPINNVDQPPNIEDLQNYVRKSTTTVQYVFGPMKVGTAGTKPSQFGSLGGASPTISVLGSGSSSADTSYVDGNTGIYAYGAGVATALIGYSNSISGTSYGVYAAASDDGYAARFYGPVTLVTNTASDVAGDAAVSGVITADQGLACISGELCALLAGASNWLDAAHSGDGTALYGASGSSEGIAISTADGVTENGSALQGYSDLSIALTGYGDPGIYGRAAGTLAAKKYVGIGGVSSASDTGLLSRIGVFGESQGGLGSVNYGTQGSPKYDLAAGIRACVKSAQGSILAKSGVYGSGGEYAGYFDGSGADGGDVLIASVCSTDSFQACEVDSDCGGGTCEGRLVIGTTYLTKRNLSGLLCKMSGVSQPADCPQ